MKKNPLLAENSVRAKIEPYRKTVYRKQKKKFSTLQKFTVHKEKQNSEWFISKHLRCSHKNIPYQQKNSVRVKNDADRKTVYKK